MATLEEGFGGRGPVGDYLARKESAANAMGNWVCGERGFLWSSIREQLEQLYQAIPLKERKPYAAVHTETMMALANCETIEKSGQDPKHILF